MPSFDKRIERVRLRVSHEGYINDEYGHGAHIEMPDGWNDQVPKLVLTLSVVELRDLKYLIESALSKGKAP